MLDQLRLMPASFCPGAIGKAFCSLLLLTLCLAPPARSQDSEFLPEVDAYLKLNPDVRTYLQAKDDREGGDPTQFEFGPSIEFYLKPLLRPKQVALFDLDDSKSRPLVLEAGYRLLAQPNTPLENRELVAATFNFPLGAGVHLSDRNRFDLDWKEGKFTWRYRNKVTLERTFAVRSYHLIPYIAAEPFYESQYSKWSSTDLYAGCLFPVGKHFQFNVYYEHENNTGKKPNQQQNDVGLALYMYFSAPKQ
ncbi:MAG TPA: DUF2490 domain-containing protein [Candidatus Acidoferrum sp.]|nr:DUF2490 domain-containing protein [Candidatus Acidoferrum sp.]